MRYPKYLKYAPYRREIMLRQNSIVFIPIAKLVISNMTLTANSASQAVIRFDISHPSHNSQ